ncbi:aminoglycoside phosphotransferase family protein [Niabella yanshanensis]|uniref:Aminoglycoside phosphotransferase family protein n=1 Tax=Niabella yanshanensis TaxID=577386 RepID=A0ABZ0WC53_9BACT|nr:aminoglycoside phosphotransferase family protein [Niabella yanshanensis]WQD39670.1 aminoglycoside phosphotransferase family protein [Niabella yanshanensis]
MNLNDRDIAAKRLTEYLGLWKLKPEGDAFYTACSLLQPVLYRGLPAMLKIAMEAEERKGALLMNWWNGIGAAKVYEYDHQALLLERISGELSLMEMIAKGRDSGATRILCNVAKKLHAPRRSHPDFDLVTLDEWFKDLWPGAVKHGGIINECAQVAKVLLGAQTDYVVMHGDLHHQNVLYAGDRGWLAIDPKRLWGERAFDYANIFCNPDKEIALAPGRFEQQLQVVSEEADIPLLHLLKWTIAWCGLSATWILNEPQDNETADIDLGVARIALDMLQSSR